MGKKCWYFCNIYKIDYRNLIATLYGNAYIVADLTFIGDNLLASSSYDAINCIWNLSSSRPLKFLYERSYWWDQWIKDGFNRDFSQWILWHHGLILGYHKWHSNTNYFKSYWVCWMVRRYVQFTNTREWSKNQAMESANGLRVWNTTTASLQIRYLAVLLSKLSWFSLVKLSMISKKWKGPTF